MLDGEVLAFRDDRPLPFSALQQRIGRQKQVAQLVRAVPVVFMTYDILEDHDEDIRSRSLADRRERLEVRLTSLRQATAVRRSATREGGRRTPDCSTGRAPCLADCPAASWADLATLRGESRTRGVEGLMLKRRTSAYGVGRKRGDWWKWKIDPYTIDAVLIYAQPGSGRRASLLTDYTFGVWHDGELVPIAKAYSGLSNEEIAELDRWIRRHTRERFGPVRHVEPVHVFELGFEAIAKSTRHRSGHCRPLSPDAALADRQESGRRRHAGIGPEAPDSCLLTPALSVARLWPRGWRRTRGSPPESCWPRR